MPHNERIRALEALFQQFPGRAPGGSGPTGIGHATMLPKIIGPPTRSDLEEYGRMVGERQEYLDLVGQGPANVRFSQQRMNPALAPLMGAGQTNPFMSRPRIMPPGWAANPTQRGGRG